MAWAEKPLGELFEKVREVLEDRCGFDLEGMVAGVRGFDGVGPPTESGARLGLMEVVGY